MPKKKICFVTSSRADYGLLRLTLLKIAKSQKFDLQLLVTGTHLSPLFGSTFREIENDGFLDYKTANIISDKDDALSMAQSMGRAQTLMAEIFCELTNNLVAGLVDRLKILAATIVAGTSLGHLKFMSLIKNSAAMIGNSSSSIIEAPALKVSTLNIGNREAGRLLASSIKSVPSDHKLILEAVNVLTSKDFTAFDYLPYGDGENVSDLVLQILTENISKVRSVKNFYDLGGFKHE